MKLEKLYNIAKTIKENMGDKKTESNLIFSLDKASHENLQKEAYAFKNSTLVGYKSEKTFNIILLDVKFTISEY